MRRHASHSAVEQHHDAGALAKVAQGAERGAPRTHGIGAEAIGSLRWPCKTNQLWCLTYFMKVSCAVRSRPTGCLKVEKAR